MLVRQQFFKPHDEEPEIIEKVNCRCCGSYERPWVVNCCERCGRSGKARELEVRMFLEEQAKEKP